MQTAFPFRHAKTAVPAWVLEKEGAVHAGYDAASDLAAKFAVAAVEMHEADAFASEVSSYPAVTVIRKGSQHSAVVASIGRAAVEDWRELAKGQGRRTLPP